MTQSECVAMENEILLYTDETGKMNVNVRFAEEDVWVTQVQLAEIYATTRQNIGQHIENIYKDNELPREATIKKFFIVQTEGNRQVKREIDHYNLDVIIAIGYGILKNIKIILQKGKLNVYVLMKQLRLQKDMVLNHYLAMIN